MACSVYHAFVVNTNVHWSIGVDGNEEAVCFTAGRTVDEPGYWEHNASVLFAAIRLVELGFLRGDVVHRVLPLSPSTAVTSIMSMVCGRVGSIVTPKGCGLDSRASGAGG